MSRWNRKPAEMAISEAELLAMTGELDMLHNETFPEVRRNLDDAAADLISREVRQGTARRNFLAGVGGVAVLGTIAACSSSGGGSAATTPAPSTDSGSPSMSPSGSMSSSMGTSKYTGDYQVVALAAALENLAVAAYMGTLSMASASKLGKVPPAVATFVTTAMKQHQEHAAAWNAVLTSAKLQPITGTPLTITDKTVAALKAVKSVPEVATLALSLENAAADTYTYAAANVKSAGGILTAATIQPVEAMHAAILSFVLGKYPVPLSFIGTTDAVMPSAFTG